MQRGLVLVLPRAVDVKPAFTIKLYLWSFLSGPEIPIRARLLPWVLCLHFLLWR